jgi:hypothetical protein
LGLDDRDPDPVAVAAKFEGPPAEPEAADDPREWECESSRRGMARREGENEG